VLDFLVRAYVPHAVLAAFAAFLFRSPPALPDETWAKTYEPLRERTGAAADRWGELNRQSYQFDRDTPQWRELEDWRRQAEQECKAGREALRPIDERLAKDRAPVYRARRGRTLLLCVLIVVCYVLTDLLVSPASGMRLLPDTRSYVGLAVAAFCVPQVILWLDGGDPARAALLFLAADGLALTVLLVARDSYGEFARACAEAHASAAAARGEAERFYAEHAPLLRGRYPESQLRSYLLEKAGDGAEPAEAWAAVRELIGQLNAIVAQETERRNERLRAEEAERQSQAEREAQERERQTQRRTYGPDGV
jgi:hypothetical protein